MSDDRGSLLADLGCQLEQTRLICCCAEDLRRLVVEVMKERENERKGKKEGAVSADEK